MVWFSGIENPKLEKKQYLLDASENWLLVILLRCVPHTAVLVVL